MTAYDGAMIGLIVAGMVWGAWRGITWQLASIASLVVGYSVARAGSSALAERIPGEPAVARGLAMLVIYAAVSGGIFLVAWVVRAALRRLRFEAYDRHLGMILGGLEGALVGVVGTLFVVALAPQTREPVFGSQSGRVVARVMDSVGPALPPEVRKVVEPFWAHVSPDRSPVRELGDELRGRIGKVVDDTIGAAEVEVERQVGRWGDDDGRGRDPAYRRR